MGHDSGSYDALIDAEREALARTGRKVHKSALIRSLREATGLSLKDAKHAVGRYLGRREGRIDAKADQPSHWIDGLLDAERASARREDRPLTKIVLIKALRGASGLGLRPARLAVEDYLRRKGGEGLRSGGRGGVFAVLAVLIVLGSIVAWFALR